MTEHFSLFYMITGDLVGFLNIPRAVSIKSTQVLGVLSPSSTDTRPIKLHEYKQGSYNNQKSVKRIEPMSSVLITIKKLFKRAVTDPGVYECLRWPQDSSWAWRLSSNA